MEETSLPSPLMSATTRIEASIKSTIDRFLTAQGTSMSITGVMTTKFTI
jgi:hypothetical protein